MMMNKEQKKIVTYSLYGLSAVLVLVFWRLGTQYEYSNSLLIIKLSESRVGGPLLGVHEIYGVRLRMGLVGILIGTILPAALASAAAFISKSDNS